MKSYAIYDKALQRENPIGYLFYFEDSKSYIVELCDDLDEWEAPLLFQKYVCEKEFTIEEGATLMWIRERVIPPGRQNIGAILKRYKMKEYNEMDFLALSGGRCSQDECYIREVSLEDIPNDIQTRQSKTLTECFPTEDGALLCLFRDNAVYKVELNRLEGKHPDAARIRKHRPLLDSVKVGAGGYTAVFDESIKIPYKILRQQGKRLPLVAKDFCAFINRSVLDTTRVCEMLHCSRQNLAYLVKERKIHPIIQGTKENLYLRGEVERLKAD